MFFFILPCFLPSLPPFFLILPYTFPISQAQKVKTKNQKPKTKWLPNGPLTYSEDVVMKKVLSKEFLFKNSPRISTPSTMYFHCSHNIGKTIPIWSCKRNNVIIEHFLIRSQCPLTLYRFLFSFALKNVFPFLG